MTHFATKATRSLALLSGTLIATASHAAATIEIDDQRSVTIGAGLRAGGGFVEDAAPNGTDDS